MDHRHHHHHRNPVFTDYARKENGVLGTDTTHFMDDDDSAKQHSLLSHVEDAAVKWCHNALMEQQHPPTHMAVLSPLFGQQPTDQHPRIIQARSTFAPGILGNRSNLAWDESTPSTLSASIDSYDSLSSCNTNLEDDDGDDVKAVPARPYEASCSSYSNTPNMRRKTGKRVVTDHNADICFQKKCGMLCLTTEAAFQQMVLGGNKTDDAVDDYGDSTAEESLPSFTLSCDDSTEKAKDRLYSESLFTPPAPNTKNKMGHQPKFNTRFSHLWKKTVNNRTFRTLTMEKLQYGQARGIYEARQREEVEVRLMMPEDDLRKESNPTTNTYAKGGTLHHTFRRLIQLRNQRQHAKVQQQSEYERCVYGHKVSVVPNDNDHHNTTKTVESTCPRPYDEDRRVVDRGGDKKVASYVLKLQQKPQDRKPFDEDSTDVEIGTSQINVAHRRQLLPPSKPVQKPPDEESQGMESSALYEQGDFKIVGKWKEEGEDDSAFYSVADTPFMKRSLIYRERTDENLDSMKEKCGELSTIKEVLVEKTEGKTDKKREEKFHEFSMKKETVANKSEEKIVEEREVTNQEVTRKNVNPPKAFTSLERKLQKSRQPPPNPSRCSSCITSSDVSSDAFSTAAVLAALNNRGNEKQRPTKIVPKNVFNDTRNDSFDDRRSSSVRANANIAKRTLFLRSIKESEWDLPSGSSIYADDSDTVEDSASVDGSSGIAIHKSFQY
ncbi:hypothetical protein IV203_025842 [Nitzschia inconspicua]|uniref:Uncharacterized protein n=1 Tax=Nitzschia inconspicua TaxID=303405 RepID=A0A9K3LJL3_9STRA|nr:hypothetical protein IV203_017690 [Nitzschia inconspicua]KAG7362176.1 hypothetical protein IV203_025842 [Nitzschia inconspicua]